MSGSIIDADKLQNEKFLRISEKERRKLYLIMSINSYLSNASDDIAQSKRYLEELKEMG